MLRQHCVTHEPARKAVPPALGLTEMADTLWFLSQRLRTQASYQRYRAVITAEYLQLWQIQSWWLSPSTLVKLHLSWGDEGLQESLETLVLHDAAPVILVHNLVCSPMI
ncbi:hypothetical protein CapIbe_001639 [Capra ibex]